jgi:hypothetical protein
MNPLFWLSLATTAVVAYHVGVFITLRDLRVAAEELMDQMHQDNQTGTPLSVSLAREMGIEL